MLSARPWHLEAVLQLLLRLVACFCVGILLGNLVVHLMGGPAAPGARFAMFLVFTASFHGAILVLTHLCLREHSMGWSEGFGLRAPRLWHTLLLAAAAAVLALPVAWLLGRGSEVLMRLVHWKVEVQNPVEILQGTTHPLAKIVFGVVAIGLAPVAEEILFRGLLYGTAQQFGFQRAGLWGTSLLFALTHMNAVTFIPLLVFAVILAFLYENTRNLLAPILTHSLFNAVNFVAIVLDTQPVL
jgi:membrane protease YdiL (CAAX protease family)